MGNCVDYFNLGTTRAMQVCKKSSLTVPQPYKSQLHKQEPNTHQINKSDPDPRGITKTYLTTKSKTAIKIEKGIS